MGLLAKRLEKLFFGSVGGTATIQNAVAKGPTDAKVISDLSMASRQPLRYIANITFGGSAPVVNSEEVNDIGTIVWIRSQAGQYYATLAGAFAGTVIPKTIFTATHVASLIKTTSATVFLNPKLVATGNDSDTLGTVDIVIEVLQVLS